MSSSSSSTSGSSSPSPSRKRLRDNSDATEDSSSDSETSEVEIEEEDEDAPVLSHAALRRQKKAAKLAAKKEAEGLPSKKRKLENGSAPAPANKRQNSVWVGNMSYKTTQGELAKFFETAGEVIRVYIPTRTPPNPSMKPENRG
jgi:RNA recognition motif-containing protein